MKCNYYLYLIILFLSCEPHAKKELPILSYSINKAGKKEYYAVTYSKFTNQDNEPFTNQSLEEKVAVATFFFTRCPSICPPMRRKLITLSESLESRNEVVFVSHTIDPNYDTTTILKTYATSTGIASHRWQFIRSTDANTKAMAEQFMTNFKPNSDGTDFYHSSYAALLDQNQYIRGFYNILIEEDLKRLEQDIFKLLD